MQTNFQAKLGMFIVEVRENKVNLLLSMYMYINYITLQNEISFYVTSLCFQRTIW